MASFKKITGILSLLAVVISGCAGLQTDGKEENASQDTACADNESAACDAYEIKDEDGSDVLKAISFDEAIEIFKSGQSAIIYFGYPGCPWCQEAEPVLEETALKLGKTVYYVRTRDEEKNRLYSDEQKAEIYPYLKEYMPENEEGEPTLYVPLVVAVKEGQVAMGHTGTFDDHDATERTMTDEEISELKMIYTEILESE